MLSQVLPADQLALPLPPDGLPRARALHGSGRRPPSHPGAMPAHGKEVEEILPGKTLSDTLFLAILKRLPTYNLSEGTSWSRFEAEVRRREILLRIGRFSGAGISLFGLLALGAIFFEAFDCEIRNDLEPVTQHVTIAVVCRAPGDLQDFGVSQRSMQRLAVLCTDCMLSAHGILGCFWCGQGFVA